MDTNIVMLLVSTAPVASYKNVFLDNKFAVPSLPPMLGQELVCKVRIHMSSIWRGGADQRIYQASHWVCEQNGPRLGRNGPKCNRETREHKPGHKPNTLCSQ